ncbi:MAG: hypothetical protein ACJARP_002095, partial [Vicingaceae bacterium]
MKKVIYSIVIFLLLSLTVFAQKDEGLGVTGEGDELQFFAPVLGNHQVGAGGALDFDGVNDVVAIPHATGGVSPVRLGGLEGGDLEPPGGLSGGFSIEFWFSPDTLLGTQTWVSKVSVTNDSGYVVKTIGDSIQCSVRMAATWVTVGFLVIEGEWQHVAFSAEDESDVKGYWNGILRNTVITGNSFVNSEDSLKIGSGNGLNFADGKIDELRIWDATLDSSTIREYITKRLDYSHSYISDLSNYFQFDENSGATILPDLAGGSDGILTNMDVNLVWVNSGAMFATQSSQTFGGTSLSHTLMNGTVITVSNFTTNPAAIFIYGSESPPEGTSFPTGLITKDLYEYFGIKTIGGGNYDVEIDFFADEQFSSEAPLETIRAFKRENGADTDFTSVSSFFDTDVANRNIKMSAQSDGEFIFGFLNTAYPKESGAGYALDFDGVDDYVDLGNSIDLASKSFTIELWAKRNSSNTFDHFFSLGTGSTNNGLHARINSDGSILFGFFNNNLTSAVQSIDSGWHHYAFTYNASNNFRAIYRDGVQIASETVGTDFLGSGPFLIGENVSGFSNPWHGEIDEFRVWETELSQTEIRDGLAKKATLSHPQFSNLFAYYKFDENTGTTVEDVVGGLDGSFISSPNWVLSGAELGDDVSYTFGGSSVKDTLADGTSISVENFTGSPDALFLYTVSDTAQNSSFPNIGNFSFVDSLQYIGVNMMNGKSYDVVFDFSNNPAFSSAEFVKTVVAFKRSNGSDGTWEQVTGEFHIDVANKTLTIPGQTGTEYVLGFSNTTYPSEPGSGYALNFNGTDDYLTVPASSNLNFTEEFTIEGWINANSSASLGAIYSQFEGGFSNSRVELQFKSSAKIGLILSDDGATNTYFLESNSIIPLNEWVHVAATFKGGTGVVLYINGVNESFTSSGTVPTTIFSSAEITTIGASRQGAQNFYNGAIDEMRVWSTALSENDIRNWMAKKLNSSHDSISKLVSYYRFDENAGTTIQDLSGGNHATINSSPSWSTSGAAIGDSSVFSYGGTDLTLNYPNGDGLTVNNLTGSPAGVHIYYVNDSANTTTIPPGIDSMKVEEYGGTFIVGGTNPTYSIEYTYSTTPLSANAEREINLVTRPSNDSPGWVQGNLSNRSYTVGINNVIIASNSESSEFALATGANNALDFDGVNDYVDLGAVSSFPTGSDARTIEAWVKRPVSASSDGSIFSYGSSVAHNRFGFRISASGEIGLDIHSSQVYYTANLNDDQWHHVAISYESGQPISAAKFYVDGVEQTTLGVNSSTGIIPNTILNDAAIGSRLEGTSLYLEGSIDELRVWRRALCQEEIVAHMGCEALSNQTDLLAYYDFNQGAAAVSNSGETALTDRTVNGNNGTLTNFTLSGTSSNWVAGSDSVSGECSSALVVCGGYPTEPGSGYALNFDGTDDFVAIPHNPVPVAATSLTIEAWIKPEVGGINQNVILKGNYGWGMTLFSGNQLGYWSNSNALNCPSFSTVPIGKWTHVAIVVNENVQTDFYINGVLVGSSTNPLHTTINNGSNQDLIIGKQGTGCNCNYWNGNLDEIRVWDAALSQTEIQDWMTKKINTTHPEFSNLVAYYRFDENTGTTLTDLAGGNDGTLTNSPTWVASGAALGDNSMHTYGGTSLSETLSNGNVISLNGFEGSPDGIHIYTVTDTAQGSTYPTSITNADSTEYFGVFMVGGDSYDVTVDYTNNTAINGQSNESFVRGIKRSGGEDATWERTGGEFRTDVSLNSIYIPNQTGTEYVLGFSNTTYPTEPGSGYTLEFDGSDDYINAGNLIDLANKSFSIQFWAKKGRINTEDYIAGQGLNATNLGLQVGFTLSNTFKFGFYSNDLYSPAYGDIDWHHWACTYNSTTKARKIYRDGILVASDVATANLTSSGDFNIGRAYPSNPNYFAGSVDDLEIWETELTQTEIRDWMTRKLNSSHPKFAKLVSYYRFDDNFGTTISDLVGGNDGILTNMDPGSDWVQSGAALGDSSGYTYGGTDISITNVNGEELLANSFTGSPDGMHLYYVNDTANTTTAPPGLEFINAVEYAGTFVVGGTSPTYSLKYTYATTTLSAIEEREISFVTRPSNAVLGWAQASLTNRTADNAGNNVIQANNTGSSEFALGVGANNALYFDGSNYDYIQASDAGFPAINTPRTMEAWVKTNSTASQSVMEYGNVTTNQRSALLVSSLGKLLFVGQNNDFSGSATVNDNKWHHVAVTFDSDSLRLYVDGQADGVNQMTLNTTLNFLRIGMRGNSLSEQFNGEIDEVKIWNRALCADELSFNRNCESPGNTDSLLVYYNFNQGSASQSNIGLDSLVDLSGNGNTGTLTNFVLGGSTSNWVSGTDSIAGGCGVYLAPTLSLVLNVNTITCNGLNDAWIKATGSGSNGYSYAWSNGSNLDSISSLSPGKYLVTVTGICGSTTVDSVTVTEPTAITASISSQTNVYCNGNTTGAATAVGSGGTAGYAYMWSNGVTAVTASNLGAGTYYVTVTDANGCSDSSSVIVTEPAAFGATITSQTNVLCNGASTGSATAQGSGGNGNYFYSWSSNTGFQTNATATGLVQGTYTV